MISQGEAKMRAAELALGALACVGLPRGYPDTDREAVLAELAAIETWLRRRACGGDKILLRQMERPTARQVRPTGRAARAIESAAKARGKP